ncbi:MAG: hypothetical protein Q7J32_06435 [Sphingomonadaceae bacterium]|nr:hypothetical protein [Sphingomonadaceae bacterium]
MNLTIGAAVVAIAALTAPALAQTAAVPAAPAAAAKPQGVRIACKQEAVTGSFTRKARQCRHAVGGPKREAAASAKKPQNTAPAQAGPAAAATAPAPASTPSQPGDIDAAASTTKGL